MPEDETFSVPKEGSVVSEKEDLVMPQAESF